MKIFLSLLLFVSVAFGQKIDIYDSQGNRSAQTLSGDLTNTSSGVTTLSSGWTKFTVSGVNAKTTGATTIGTTASGTANFHPCFLVVESTASSLITITSSLSVGTNSTSFNNIVPITVQTGLTAASLYFKTEVTVATAPVAPSTAIKVNITTGATGTSQTISVTLFGYYQ